jgi:hypothetical protein
VETRDVVFDTIANERLAASDANLADAEAKKNAREPVELGPRENFIVIAVIFRVGGAAVHATEIAAIRNGDAEVGDLAAEFVMQGHGVQK